MNANVAMQAFASDEFGEVRTLSIDSSPWFVGMDVAKALGYSNASKAVMAHVYEEDKRFEIASHRTRFPKWESGQNRQNSVDK